MRTILAALFLPLILAGCGLVNGITAPAPSEYAAATILDERAALSVELAYKAERLALEVAVDAGLLTGNAAAVAADLDRRAYTAVQAVRKAYEAGNSDSYDAAILEAHAALALAMAAIRGETQ